MSALISSMLTVFCYWTIEHLNAPKDDILDESYGIKEINEIDYDSPSFSIVTTGLFISIINNESINGLKAYELSAVISDGIYTYKSTYKGIKVKDVIEKINFDDYNKIVFKSNGGLQVEYAKNELDDLYFVFEKDNILYPVEEPVALLNPNVYDRYNITNIEKIEFLM